MPPFGTLRQATPAGLRGCGIGGGRRTACYSGLRYERVVFCITKGV